MTLREGVALEMDICSNIICSLMLICDVNYDGPFLFLLGNGKHGVQTNNK